MPKNTNPPTLKLTSPSSKYKTSYLASLKELDPTKLDPFHRYLLSQHKDFTTLFDWISTNFDDYLQIVNNRSTIKSLSSFEIPQHIFWLVKKDQYLGYSLLRTKLNPKLSKIGGHISYFIRPSKRRKGYGTTLLTLTLNQAKKHKINPLLLTCNINNTASLKIIESNHGQKLPMTSQNPDRVYYQITTPHPDEGKSFPSQFRRPDHTQR